MSDKYTGKALSIRQPWAWLIANGYKDIENRTWKSDHRGWTMIHAGKKIDREGYDWVRENFPAIPMPPITELQTGSIVGKMLITECVMHSKSPWFFGPYGFGIEAAGSIDPIPCLGKLGFFKPAI